MTYSHMHYFIYIIHKHTLYTFNIIINTQYRTAISDNQLRKRPLDNRLLVIIKASCTNTSTHTQYTQTDKHTHRQTHKHTNIPRYIHTYRNSCSKKRHRQTQLGKICTWISPPSPVPGADNLAEMGTKQTISISWIKT